MKNMSYICYRFVDIPAYLEMERGHLPLMILYLSLMTIVNSSKNIANKWGIRFGLSIQR